MRPVKARERREVGDGAGLRIGSPFV